MAELAQQKAGDSGAGTTGLCPLCKQSWDRLTGQLLLLAPEYIPVRLTRGSCRSVLISDSRVWSCSKGTVHSAVYLTSEKCFLVDLQQCMPYTRQWSLWAGHLSNTRSTQAAHKRTVSQADHKAVYA